MSDLTSVQLPPVSGTQNEYFSLLTAGAFTFVPSPDFVAARD